MGARVLLVEDDAALREALGLALARGRCEVTAVETGEAALSALADAGADLVVSDIRLPGMDGLTLLRRARETAAATPVVLMTAYADAALAIEALKSGARDLLLKPFGGEQLLAAVQRHAAAAPAAEAEAASGLIAHDPATRALVARAERAARSSATVLLTGESGVGKEVMARHLHLASRRAGGPFVAINCAAIPETLLESTLFGHERGAFTGAARSQPGKFEQAQGGTLFLDEVGELPEATQAKLLRVLQERCVERVGGLKPVPVDIRLIAATNRDLSREVAEGRFREDLYYRLAVFPVALPALRERPADILPLARRFAERYAHSFGLADCRLSPAAEAALLRHRWPGNVRELENTIQRALLLADGPLVEPQHLELPAEAGSDPAAAARAHAGPADAAAATPPEPAAPPALTAARPRNVRDVEREHILGVLEQVKGNRRAAIAILGISERALRYKLKAFRDQGLLPCTPTHDTATP